MATYKRVVYERKRVLVTARGVVLLPKEVKAKQDKIKQN